MITKFPTELLAENGITLTPLRKDILTIFLSAKNPLSAYEVLAKLKKKRPNAEPPTAYRVIDFFMQKKLLHRIETENKYVFCSHLDHIKSQYHGILFLCEQCHSWHEYLDDELLKFIKHFSEKNKLLVKESVIEMKGICKNCIM